MAIAEGLGGLARVGLHEAGITVRQVQGEEVDFARNAGDDGKRLAKVDLGVTWFMLQWHEDLLGPAFACTDIIRDDRHAAFQTMLVAKPLENPFCRVALFVAARLIVLDDCIDDPGKGIELRTADRLGATLAQWD